MLFFCLLHFIIILVTILDLISKLLHKLDTNLCYTFHTLNHSVYILFNITVFFFFFDCARNARIHSTDIVIFDTKKKLWIYALIIPVVLLGGHFLANIMCSIIKFPKLHTIVYSFHIGFELLIVYFYFGWYQRQLREFVGGIEHEQDVNPADSTFDTSQYNK